MSNNDIIHNNILDKISDIINKIQIFSTHYNNDNDNIIDHLKEVSSYVNELRDKNKDYFEQLINCNNIKQDLANNVMELEVEKVVGNNQRNSGGNNKNFSIKRQSKINKKTSIKRKSKKNKKSVKK